MKKFSQVESRIRQTINQANQFDDLRPQHDSGKKTNLRARPGSARPGTAQGRQTGHVAFGRTGMPGQNFERSGSQIKPNNKIPPKNPATTDLSKNALAEFDKLNRAPQIEEKMSIIDNGQQMPIQMQSGKENMLPPKTPNYGKTPKYITKYKEEAKVQAERKEEERLAKMRPPGTRLMPEAERIETLETLMANKKELTKIY